MEIPFIFGKIATEKNFTGREQETAYLVSHFTSLINTIIVSPRRWGKSSLVNKRWNRIISCVSVISTCSMSATRNIFTHCRPRRSLPLLRRSALCDHHRNADYPAALLPQGVDCRRKVDYLDGGHAPLQHFIADLGCPVEGGFSQERHTR